MSTSLRSFIRLVLLVLGWIPFLVFFSIISFMFLTDFRNPVDEYFVTLILKACFMLIVGAFLSQITALAMILAWAVIPGRGRFLFLNSAVDFINAFPVVDIGIFSIAIFFTAPGFGDWVAVLTALLVVPTLGYWILFFRGPVRKLHLFGTFHKVKKMNIHQTLSPFYIKSFLDFFFVIMKRHLMPLVFVLVVLDFRIILPRLLEAGLSYQAFALFLSLIISLHLLSYKQEVT